MDRQIVAAAILLMIAGFAAKALCQVTIPGLSDPASKDRANGVDSSQSVRINQMQWIGTHNSYHIAPDSVAMGIIKLAAQAEARSIDCTQRPLTEQLECLGMRHFELDLFRDPDGTLYRSPACYQIALDQKIDVLPFDPDQRLHQPGVKVLHSPDFDFRTHVHTLRDALSELNRWLKAHPDEGPLFVLLELKSASFSPATKPLPWTAAAIEELEASLLEEFTRDQILAPDNVRADKPTLRDAVQGTGWPTLADSRGKIVFLLDNEDSVRDAYLAKSEILEKRLLFASVAASHPAAAWMKRNDPIGSFDEIGSLVQQGFLVRTRADSGTKEARANDTYRRDRAIESGAQLISTDYPEADQRFSSYCVSPELLTGVPEVGLLGECQPPFLNGRKPHERIDDDQLDNLMRLSPRIFSGSEPVGDPAFAKLAELGIRTIVSVDAVAPDVETARRYGLRYIHIPIGYDGIEQQAGLSIARVMRDRQGPVYFHCHHGRHRGPAAAAVACIADGALDHASARAALEAAGTSPAYAGLWRDVAGYKVPSPTAELPDLVEVARVDSVAEAMAKIGRTFDNLVLLRDANWGQSRKSPDLVASQQALLLQESFHELGRALAGEDAPYRQLLTEAETLSQSLRKALVDRDAERATAAFSALESSCKSCHRKHRD